MKGILIRSIDDKEKIILFYIDSNNQITRRLIRVVHFNHKYIKAYCFWRNEMRTFKLENILSVSPMKQVSVS